VLEKIKKYENHPLTQNFKDIRFLGFLLFGVLVLLATWSGVRVIETNYDLQKQITQLDQQNTLQKLQNSNLKLQNDYYKSDTYLELTARKQFGKAAPGEKLILVPKSVALAKAKELPKDDQQTAENSAKNQSKYQQNFEAWMDFLFRKNQS
jgi:cell division protein FtsB